MAYTARTGRDVAAFRMRLRHRRIQTERQQVIWNGTRTKQPRENSHSRTRWPSWSGHWIGSDVSLFLFCRRRSARWAGVARDSALANRMDRSNNFSGTLRSSDLAESCLMRVNLPTTSGRSIPGVSTESYRFTRLSFSHVFYKRCSSNVAMHRSSIGCFKADCRGSLCVFRSELLDGSKEYIRNVGSAHHLVFGY